MTFQSVAKSDDAAGCTATPSHIDPANDNGTIANLAALAKALTPIIQARAARALLRRHGHRAQFREVRQEVEELTQEVFVTLFADDARTLRAWDAARGLSLLNFAGLLAEREIYDILSSGRRRPWLELPAVDFTECDPATDVDPEAAISARQLCDRVRARIGAELSPQAARLFTFLFVEERSVEDVQSATGLRRDAVYAWRSRLAKTLRRIAADLNG